ncbi:Catalase-related immune-responsive [Microdochium nivale]|nr:Catalase-related immune-responsive [Microdochium nivale]
MFTGSRRHRPPAHKKQISTPTNPNAATAAASAFMAASNQNANKALSSAAAAAALRARPHTPIDVGAVETKRTQRRSASVSSFGSATRSSSIGARPRQGHGLERKQSSGSMTERTFRTPSPSPHRAASHAPAQAEPPVPQIPANHRKTQSVGMQTFRTASQRMQAEPPSYYGSSRGNPGNVRTTDAAMRTGRSITRDNFEPPVRSESRASSINYSYPTTFRPQSPPASPTFYRAPIPEESRVQAPISPPRSSRTSAASSVGSKLEPALVYDPNSRRMVAAPQPSNIEYDVREAANRQPKKKKKKQDQGLGRSGSHLAKGTMGRAKGTEVNEEPQEVQPAPQQATQVKATPTQRQQPADDFDDATTYESPHQPRQSHFEGLGLSDVVSQDAPPVLAPPERLASPPPVRSVQKKPSMVREEPEGEEDVPEIITPLSQKVLNAVEAAPLAATTAPKRQATDDDAQHYPVEEAHAISPDELYISPVAAAPARSTIVPENKSIAQISRESSAARRTDSISPDRRARFGSSVSEQLTVRHHPLPRSASPIKSALKRSGTPSRDVSPSENGSDGHLGNVAMMQDSVAARKKAVRVSFDERSNVIMGESAGGADSPASSSPKRPWYSSIGRSKKRDIGLEEDEVMKPRPALPSFGSVREKKARELEERPLVRPADATRPSVESSSQAIRPGSPDVPTYRDADEQAVLARDHELRNEANTSRFREPLPPVVTSVGENGYHMDTTTDESDNDLLDQSDLSIGDDTVQTTQTSYHGDLVGKSNTVPVEIVEVQSSRPEPKAVVSTQPIPAIALTMPSPPATESATKTSQSQPQHYFGVPGGFPDEEAPNATSGVAETAGASTAIFEPEAAIQPAQSEKLPQTTLVTTGPPVIAQQAQDTSSDESIYSDAYEDISDMEGGFGSIDAVVESPITKSTHSFPSHLPPPASPLAKGSHVDLPETPQLQARQVTGASPQVGQTSEADEDWSQAETFWRSLTAEKRQQLAREALEDEGAEADREDISTPIRRNSSRRKSAEKRALAAASAAQSTSTKDTHDDSQRTYMVEPGSKAKHEVPPSPENTHMRKSLRGPQPLASSNAGPPAAARGSLRKSMRGAPEPRAQAPAPALAVATRQQNDRPSTSSGNVAARSANPQTQSVTGLVDTKAASTALAKQMMPKLGRRGSDASDSSFQRSRRPASSAGFGMRSSMRQAPAARREMSPSRGSTKGSSRWSLRSLSPPATFRRNSSSLSVNSTQQNGTLRQSLRTNVNAQEPKRNSLHLPFGKNAKPASQTKSARSSRFGGSSDEEEEVRPAYKSRFNDSSDEDERPASSSQGSALSRGSLRAKGTGSSSFRQTTPVPEEPEDSDDLPDSDDEQPALARGNAPVATVMAQRPGVLSRTTSDNIGTNALRRSGSGLGAMTTTTIASSSPTSPRQRRGSFMGSILRRNKRGDPASKIQRSEFTESAARRDTPLERNNEALKEIRADTRPSSPRTQRKLFGRKREEQWALPEETEGTAGVNAGEPDSAASPILQRPISSSGKLVKNNGMHQRPVFAGRRSTSLGLPGAETNGNGVTHSGYVVADQESIAAVSEAGGPRKKKFGALRRMFGLTG